RHVVLRHFMGANFALVRIESIFDAYDGRGFKRLTFFEKLLDAFRVEPLVTRNALVIPGLAPSACFGGLRCQPSHAPQIESACGPSRRGFDGPARRLPP